MKRDARIGLAVVLVLGLSVTLLIGRALYKRTPPTATEGDAELAGDSPSVDGPRVDSPAPTGLNPAASASSNPSNPIPSNSATNPPPHETAAVHQPEATNPALQRFVDDQSRPIPSQPQNVPTANAVPSPNNVPNGGTRPIAGNPTPEVDRTLLLDHEEATPPGRSSDENIPADGYGYTVANGDNPWKIAAKVYGDGKYTQKIVEANPGVNVKNMKVGTVIKIPLITNKSILMKLPSFAEASHATKANTDNSAVAHHQSMQNTPPVAESHVEAPEKHTAATSHKIESGDTLSSIAKKYYGASGPKTIAKIVAANNGLDASKLKVGQEINIPAK